MLLHINKNSSMVQRIEEDSNDIAIIAARLSNELGGWAQYKELAANNAARYETIMVQRFQHTLVALNDLVVAMRTRMTEKEEGQWQNFCSSVIAKEA